MTTPPAATFVPMKLEYPLSGLVARCMTVCLPECCGRGAFDFSPLHIASFLVNSRDEPDLGDVARLREQLGSLRANHGHLAGHTSGVDLDEMGNCFTPGEVDDLVWEISENLEIALALIRECKRLRAAQSENPYRGGPS